MNAWKMVDIYLKPCYDKTNMERRTTYMFEMAEVKVEELEVVDVITTSMPGVGENQTPWG